MKVVYIQWLDSVREDDGWHEYRPLTKEKLYCDSVGYILHEDDDFIEIAQSITDNAVLFTIAIPKQSIINKKYIMKKNPIIKGIKKAGAVVNTKIRSAVNSPKANALYKKHAAWSAKNTKKLRGK